MSQDNHLRSGSHNISFKSHVKSLGVYIDATLTLAKYIDHISRAAFIEIRRISSIRHLLTRKATVQLMCSFVLNRLDYCNSLLIDITSDQVYDLPKNQNHAAKVVFRKSRHECVKPLLKKIHWIPVKETILFKIDTFAFRFFGDTLLPYLSSCPSVYTPLVLSVPVLLKIKIPVQAGSSVALVTGRSQFRRPLFGTIFLPTSDTAVPSYSSELLLKLYALSELPLIPWKTFVFVCFHRLLLSVLLICQ